MVENVHSPIIFKRQLYISLTMNLEQQQLRQQTAQRMTIFCLISLVLGAYIAWANNIQGSNDTTSTILPLVVVAFVHLLGGAVAISNAFKTKNVIKNLPIYAYFIFVLLVAIRILIAKGFIF